MQLLTQEGQADLHTHTQASDGAGTPSHNVRIALAAGLKAVAITDHDTVAGLEEAEAEGRRLGIAVVPGVEISTVAEGKDIHVLGYYFRRDDCLFLSRLAELRSVRDRRNDMIIEKLRQLSIDITLEEVLEHRRSKSVTFSGETIGRPHIAEVLIKKGCADSLKDAFDRYLGEHGAAYANPPRIGPEEAIAWIHEAGGAAVLAHPGLYGRDALVERLAASAGLDGLEAFHSDHSLEDVRRYQTMADSFGLIATAGSDYHGERNGIVFHGPLGSQRASLSVLKALEAKAQDYRSIS